MTRRWGEQLDALSVCVSEHESAAKELYRETDADKEAVLCRLAAAEEALAEERERALGAQIKKTNACDLEAEATVGVAVGEEERLRRRSVCLESVAAGEEARRRRLVQAEAVC
jgi:hypothetical protein